MEWWVCHPLEASAALQVEASWFSLLSSMSVDLKEACSVVAHIFHPRERYLERLCNFHRNMVALGAEIGHQPYLYCSWFLPADNSFTAFLSHICLDFLLPQQKSKIVYSLPSLYLCPSLTPYLFILYSQRRSIEGKEKMRTFTMIFS